MGAMNRVLDKSRYHRRRMGEASAQAHGGRRLAPTLLIERETMKQIRTWHPMAKVLALSNILYPNRQEKKN